MNDEPVWDVVVIGAGPAGASGGLCGGRHRTVGYCSWRRRSSRYKTCGGGIIGPSRTHCLPATNFRCATGARGSPLSSTGGCPARRAPGAYLFGLIDRPEFDAGLVDAAREAGAVLRTGAPSPVWNSTAPACPTAVPSPWW